MNEEEVNEMLQNLAFDAVIAGEEGPLVVESEADEETVLNSWIVPTGSNTIPSKMMKAQYFFKVIKS